MEDFTIEPNHWTGVNMCTAQYRVFKEAGRGFRMPWTVRPYSVFVLVLLCTCMLPDSVRAQQAKPEDPEDEKGIGLWLDQGISAGVSTNRSLEFEVHERSDQGVSNLFEYFFQGGVAFRLRPWFTVLPSYRYQRFPGNPNTTYENRLLLNLTLSTSRGNWRPSLRTLIEERFPDNRNASARIRFRPGVDYTLPLKRARRPVLGVTNEFFIVPGSNSFSSNGAFTQYRVQVGARLPLTDTFSIRPYYMVQFVNLPTGWDSNGILGISVQFKTLYKSKRQ